ncbi:hypothetical protein [Flavihumibacter petaseus]|uniref:Uncharacterized protein n=1 Tax=Flavihumibacter petaseus NBRC 106054 TaxID=1220578 RepID=A0A0E9MWR6_9BACT|nr:hypothetical protein [Flavihumibacter petaseus]GAO41938.1 hypothetical protein FPE01S_01_09530 [Flavihumibacter petaseus NBRC 106054]
MSQAFVKEEDAQWLSDLQPTLTALIYYLTRENNSIRVYEMKATTRKDGKTLHHMSNGLPYFVNDDRQWEIDW